VDRLQAQMLEAADGLGDRRVEDVGADRRDGIDPEYEDQQRSHQGGSPHAGHADQQANTEAEYDDRWIHGECRVSAVSVFVDRNSQKCEAQW
jgi:hypothetical protein